MNKHKGFIGLGLIIAIILGIVIVGGGAYYLGAKKNIKVVENSQPQETKNLSNDLYPLYQNLSWGSEVSSSQDTHGLKLSGFKIVSKNILDGEYYKLDTSFEKYYDTKLTSLGWVRDSQFQADGAGSSNWSYTKGDERIIFYYNSTAINQKPNEPLSCPCNMVFEIFSGKENIDKTKIISTALPAKYLNSQNWPPVIKTSGFAYSCKVSSGSGDVPTVIEEKTINSKKYCKTSITDHAMSHTYTDYTYTTSFKEGIKTTNFVISQTSCGVYRENLGDGGIEYNECMNTISTFANKLDAMVDSIMQS